MIKNVYYNPEKKWWKIECSAVVEEKNLNAGSKKFLACDCHFDFGLEWWLQKTNWKNIYHEVTVIMNEVTFMLFLKKFVICCEKNFFIHLCTDGWQLKFFANMTWDCLEEHFVVFNFLCINFFDNLKKMVDIHDLSLNCKRHFSNAISMKLYCF